MFTVKFKSVRDYNCVKETLDKCNKKYTLNMPMCITVYEDNFKDAFINALNKNKIIFNEVAY